MVASPFHLCLLFPLFTLVLSRCEDGVDNAVTMNDLFNGAKNVVFEDFVMLTYDNNKRPICENGKGKVAIPGFMRFSQGQVRVKKSVEISGALKLDLSLKKNSMFVGTVCKNGKSANAFVGDDFCGVDVFQFTSPALWKKFSKEGLYDIKDIPGDWTDMKPIILQENPYIEGEWEVSFRLSMGHEAVGGVKIGKGWLTVTISETKEEL